MDRGGSVHGEVSDDAALDEIDQQWREAGLNDMSAEHDDHGTFATGSVGDRVNDLQEISRDEYVGQRFQKRCETTILAGWGGEFTGGDFVRSPLDRDRPDLGEIRFLGLAA
jgi:hypothetical protein